MMTDKQINDLGEEVAIATARYDTAWLRWTDDGDEENYIRYKDAERMLNEASRRHLAAEASASNSRPQSH